MITVSRLYIHPVKSMQGTQVSHAQALASGLAFDRIFMLTEPDGTFITARQYPEMVLFTPALIMGGLQLNAPDGSSATVLYDDFLPDAAPTEVWGNKFSALVAPQAINDWLSGFFSRPVQLRWVGPEMTRRVAASDTIPLGFADGYPYLLINESSLHDLRRRCPAGVKLEQFRPNIVITGADAWAEDGWQTLQIGDLVFDLPKPCSRCVLTTVSPQNGYKHPTGEPLATLQRFRTAADGSGDIDFGINLTARNSGIIRTGDSVNVINRRSPRLYGCGEVSESLQVSPSSEQQITIDWNGTSFTGNNQQVLLEQLEMQGIRVPYSCRAGICGSCKITLVSGEVTALKKGAVRNDGTILSCSCVPNGNLVLR